jgi:hypothetical protein
VPRFSDDTHARQLEEQVSGHGAPVSVSRPIFFCMSAPAELEYVPGLHTVQTAEAVAPAARGVRGQASQRPMIQCPTLVM